jgi:signal transduction histidine kinase
MAILRNALYQLLLPVIVVCLLAWGLYYSLTLFDPPASLRLLPVKMSPNNAMQNASATDWQPVVLPHDWRDLNNKRQRQVWYRATLPGIASAALYTPHVNAYFSVWLDDVLIYSEAYRSDYTNNRWNHPRWIELGNLQQGQVLLLRVITDQPGYGMLGSVYIGPQAQLAPYHRNWQRFHITLLEYITAAMLLMALFLGLIWWYRREETLFGFASALMLVWFLHNLQLFVVELPFPRALVDWYAKATLCWLVIAIVIFLHRLLGEKPIWFERALLLYGVTSCLIAVWLAFYIADDYWIVMSRYWDSLTLAMGVYPTYRVIRATLVREDRTITFVAMAGTLIVLFGGHDWMMVNLNFSREHGYWIHYSAVLAVSVFGVILLQRFVNALRSAEQLNVTLEQRVEQARQKIAAQYDKLQLLQQEQTIAVERERIMRDMHDGIGGHLVSCIAIVEAQPDNAQAIIDILRASLLDLRLMIDSLEPSSKDVVSILAMLRERTEQQLKLVNIHYDWQVQDVSDDGLLPPDKALQLLRILQEAITNVIKHANASTIRVAVYESAEEALADEPPAIVVEIADDGDGFDLVTMQQGYGTRNMKARSERIGARLHVQSSPAGTVIQVVLKPVL